MISNSKLIFYIPSLFKSVLTSRPTPKGRLELSHSIFLLIEHPKWPGNPWGSPRSDNGRDERQIEKWCAIKMNNKALFPAAGGNFRRWANQSQVSEGRTKPCFGSKLRRGSAGAVLRPARPVSRGSGLEKQGATAGSSRKPRLLNIEIYSGIGISPPVHFTSRVCGMEMVGCIIHYFSHITKFL